MQEVSCERSSKEQDHKDECSFYDGTQVNDNDSWIGRLEPTFESNSDAGFTCTASVVIRSKLGAVQIPDKFCT